MGLRSIFTAALPAPAPSPLPPRPATVVAPRGWRQPAARPGRRWELSGLTELLLALPWLWWSWLSVQFIGLPSTTLYVAALVAWGLLAFGTLHPRASCRLAGGSPTLA
ncbi:hypothetical protein AB0F43_05730 [Kribbella sp. NPDC023972]|uniref:hypothetical protein n=1 Tax=Kribbella sp. NPDC023972 TaxID=3154795 RepID=UPI0033FDE75D